ncbi:MAG: hypothetical protein ACFFD1_05240 [Candidatus Thorarchaeota archaeon]
MGNFHQHVSWASYTLITIQILIIYFILNFEETLASIIGNNKLNFWSIMTLPALFIIGAISPDVDLPKEAKRTSFLATIVFPIIISIAIGMVVYKGVILLIKQFPFLDVSGLTIYIVSILSASIGLVITISAILIGDRKAKHWGRVHSIGFGFIISFIIFVITLVFWGISGWVWAFLSGLTFFGGYMDHILCDQAYHELRDKQWKDKRYALKLWSNNWKYDPFIIFDEITSAAEPKKKNNYTKKDKASN